MREVQQQILVMAFFQAVILSPWLVILLYHRPRFQFGLGTILFWGFPVAAVVACILAWDEPLFSPRSVVTDKATGLILLEIFCIPIVAMRWLSTNPRQPASEPIRSTAPEIPIADPTACVLPQTEN